MGNGNFTVTADHVIEVAPGKTMAPFEEQWVLSHGWRNNDALKVGHPIPVKLALHFEKQFGSQSRAKMPVVMCVCCMEQNCMSIMVEILLRNYMSAVPSSGRCRGDM